MVLIQAVDVADAFDDVVETFCGDVVSDDEDVVDARREAHPGVVFTSQRDQVVDIAFFSCGVIIERVFDVFNLDVVVSGEVDGQGLVDVPSQLEVDQRRVDSDDFDVVERG